MLRAAGSRSKTALNISLEPLKPGHVAHPFSDLADQFYDI